MDHTSDRRMWVGECAGAITVRLPALSPVTGVLLLTLLLTLQTAATYSSSMTLLIRPLMHAALLLLLLKVGHAATMCVGLGARPCFLLLLGCLLALLLPLLLLLLPRLPALVLLLAVAVAVAGAACLGWLRLVVAAGLTGLGLGSLAAGALDAVPAELLLLRGFWTSKLSSRASL